MPDAYEGNDEASADFRRHTENELVERRVRDARRVLAGLDMSLNEPVTASASPTVGNTDPEASRAQEPFDVVLDAADGDAWMRTLAAVRLVVASRLGIESDEDDTAARAVDDDGRFGVYDWPGYRLEGLPQATDAGLPRDRLSPPPPAISEPLGHPERDVGTPCGKMLGHVRVFLERPTIPVRTIGIAVTCEGSLLSSRGRRFEPDSHIGESRRHRREEP